MFSLFKLFQKLIENLKSKKGLWFTILAIGSVVGIFLSLYVLTHMTESSSKEVYQSISSNYNKAYRNRLAKKEETFKRVFLTMKIDEQFMTSIENNNIVDVDNTIGNFNEIFKEAGFPSFNVEFYPVRNQVNQYRNSVNNVINSKAKGFGIEVLLDGIFLIYLEPIVKDDEVIGVIELKEELHELKTEYLKEDLIFVFLLEEKMLNKLSIKARNGRYREVVPQIHVEELRYNGQFFAKIIEAGKDEYKNMLEIGYSVDDTFFRAAQKVSDINGNVIGTVVLGETVDGSGAFVNIVDNMTKTVTTVALGLVISILLFMF